MPVKNKSVAAVDPDIERLVEEAKELRAKSDEIMRRMNDLNEKIEAIAERGRVAISKSKTALRK
jgi:cell division protein FtsB